MRAEDLQKGMTLTDRKGRYYTVVSFELDQDGYLKCMTVDTGKQIEPISKTLFKELCFEPCQTSPQ